MQSPPTRLQHPATLAGPGGWQTSPPEGGGKKGSVVRGRLPRGLRAAAAKGVGAEPRAAASVKSEDAVIGREGPEESQPLGRRPSGTAFLSNPSPPTRARPAANWPLPFPLHSHHPQHPPSQVLWVQGPSPILPPPRPNSNTLFGAWRVLPDTPVTFGAPRASPGHTTAVPPLHCSRALTGVSCLGCSAAGKRSPPLPRLPRPWSGKVRWGEQFNRSHCSR